MLPLIPLVPIYNILPSVISSAPLRGLKPGTPVPKAGITPLDQTDCEKIRHWRQLSNIEIQKSDFLSLWVSYNIVSAENLSQAFLSPFHRNRMVNHIILIDQSIEKLCNGEPLLLC